jgi:hypothetical protein
MFRDKYRNPTNPVTRKGLVLLAASLALLTTSACSDDFFTESGGTHQSQQNWNLENNPIGETGEQAQTDISSGFVEATAEQITANLMMEESITQERAPERSRAIIYIATLDDDVDIDADNSGTNQPKLTESENIENDADSNRISFNYELNGEHYCLEKLLEDLSQGESAAGDAGYDYIIDQIVGNGARLEAYKTAKNRLFGDPNIELTEMSVDQVMTLQSWLISQYGYSASGKWQNLHSTLEWMKEVGVVNGDQLYDKQTQIDIAIYSFKHRGMDDYLQRDMAITEFAKSLSKWYASLPRIIISPDDKHPTDNPRKSYHLDGKNQATTTAEKIIIALSTLRELTPQDWQALEQAGIFDLNELSQEISDQPLSCN